MDVIRARPSEDWRPVAGFRHYQVSSLGRVRNWSSGKLLFGERDRNGYRLVNLVADDGQKLKRRVHRLVCEAFNGPCPEGTEVSHLNGKPFDNRVDNLQWATRSENNLLKALHGTRQAGEDHPRAKLTADAVEAIRQSETPHRTIAREYGVSDGTIRKIRKGDRWT